MALPPDLPPDPALLSVVLPLQGDPVPLLDAVAALAGRWPAHVDARLVVPTAPLGARDRTVLSGLGDDVAVVELATPAPGYGELVAAALDDAVCLVLDPADLPDAADLLALAEGRPGPGGALLSAADLAAVPVLDAAGDLASLQALLTLRDPAPAPHATPALRPVPALDLGPGRPGLVSVVVPVVSPPETVRPCLDAVRRSTRRPVEVVVVVGPSTPRTTRGWLAAQRDLVVVEADAEGYAAACNRGVAAAGGEHVVLLQDHAVVPRFWVEGLLRGLEQGPRVGAVGPRALSLPGPQRVAPGEAGDPRDHRARADAWRRAHAGQGEQVRSLGGGCVLLRRDALQAVGALDEGYRGAALAHEDLSHRLVEAGWQLRVADEVLVHLPSRPQPSADLDHHGTTRVFLSAALIVKDEQRALPRCLAALRGVVDEVVVCDTGSTDRTVEVAEAFGARLLHSPWQGDFAAARNTVLAACRGTWVLSVDADEQLHVEPGVDLRRALLALDADAGAVAIRSRDDESAQASYEHQAGRLFRRDSTTWVGAVHETLAGVRTGLPPVYGAVTGVWLDHDGYVERVYAQRDKTQRNLELAEKDHAQALAAGDGRRTWKTAYELARALVAAGDDPRTGDLLEQALAAMPAGVDHLRCDALVRLASARAEQGRTTDAERAAREACAVDPSLPAARYVLARVLAVTERLEEALALLDGQPAEQPGSAVSDHTVREVQQPLLRAHLLHRLGRDADAATALLDLGAQHPEALDWRLLHTTLRTRPDGVRVLAGLAAGRPVAALAALDGLGPDDRDALAAALEDLGVDVAASRPGAVRDEQLDRTLAGHDPAAVAQTALLLEDEDLGAALELWRRLPDTPEVLAARARCLLQLGRLDDAVEAVEGLDLAVLTPPDLLVVAAVAGAAGDPGTARSLLSSLGDAAPDLREQVDGLRDALGLAV